MLTPEQLPLVIYKLLDISNLCRDRVVSSTRYQVGNLYFYTVSRVFEDVPIIALDCETAKAGIRRLIEIGLDKNNRPYLRYFTDIDQNSIDILGILNSIYNQLVQRLSKFPDKPGWYLARHNQRGWEPVKIDYLMDTLGQGKLTIVSNIVPTDQYIEWSDKYIPLPEEV